MNIRQFTPSADKRILVLLAGLMWCGVGLMLGSFAVSWLSQINGSERVLYYAAGFLAAMPIHHFGFLKIADKNLKRLLPLSEKRCLFSFMTWRSYIIVLIMVLMGIALRHSSIPKRYLSILYNGIGLALFLSGIRYFRFFFRLLFSKDNDRS
jgi:cyanate permease